MSTDWKLWNRPIHVYAMKVSTDPSGWSDILREDNYVCYATTYQYRVEWLAFKIDTLHSDNTNNKFYFRQDIYSTQTAHKIIMQLEFSPNDTTTYKCRATIANIANDVDGPVTLNYGDWYFVSFYVWHPAAGWYVRLRVFDTAFRDNVLLDAFIGPVSYSYGMNYSIWMLYVDTNNMNFGDVLDLMLGPISFNYTTTGIITEPKTLVYNPLPDHQVTPGLLATSLDITDGNIALMSTFDVSAIVGKQRTLMDALEGMLNDHSTLSISDLNSAESADAGDPSDYLGSDTYVPGGTDHLATRLESTISDWIDSFTGGLTYGTYDCHITGWLSVLRNPINYFVNTILAALVKLGVGIIDSFATFLEPLGGVIDSIIGFISPIIVEMMQDILHFLKTEANFVPFLPEICTAFINILNGSDMVTEFAAMLDAGASTYIDSTIDVINTIIHVLDYVFNIVLEVTDTSIETKDLTPFWNRFVQLLAEDDDDYASIGLYASTLGIKTLPESTFIIPVSLSSGFFNNDYDIVDIVLELWASKKFPWIHPVSIPIPIGATYIVLKDLKVPLSEYVDFAHTGPTKFGNLESGVTVKDILFDWFTLDVAVFIGHHIGIKGKQAFLLALKQVQKRIQPNIKDIIKRLSPAGEPMKYNSENLSIWDLTNLLNENVMTIQTYSDFMVQYSLYLEQYALWLQNPRNTSRPLAPSNPFS